MAIPWLARKVIKFMLHSIKVTVDDRDVHAPVLVLDLSTRLGSVSQLKFIIDGQPHPFEMQRHMMFGLLAAPAHVGKYTATICDKNTVLGQVFGQNCIKIERQIAEDKLLLHIIRPSNMQQLLTMEQQIWMSNKTGVYELVHSHTEAFRRS
jgi:hypothetical protein